MNILGISAFYHDSAATLLCDGEIIAAAQEERFTRKKHDPSLPVNAIRYCIDEAGLGMEDIDAVVFYDKPFLKFERLLETYYSFIPKGVSSFVTSIPVWVKEKMFLKSLLIKELKKIGPYHPEKQPLLFPEHHLSHAASAFFASPFDEALIVTVDGVGEWSTASISIGKGNRIEILKELRFPHSVGLLYSAFTYYLGFRVNSGEYKLMGLAPYGIPGSEEVRHFERIIREQLLDIKDDGSVWLNRVYFSYATGLRMMPEKKWKMLFGFPARKPESPTDQHHCNLAMAIQNVTEEIIMKMVQHGWKIAGNRLSVKNLCMAGGVALNCVANGRLVQHKLVENVFIQPAAGDAGGSLGAALAAHYIHFGQERNILPAPDLMKGAFLGPAYTTHDIKKELNRFKAVHKEITSFDEMAAIVAVMIDEGKIVGWFQGRMEFGPRALGNRSILGDARNAGMQKKLNLKIKYRESFRPFAPAVMTEHSGDYFDLSLDSPYMLLVAQVSERIRNPLPDNYFEMNLSDRLYYQRSEIPAITHLDYSARVQTVHRETNPRFWELIRHFRDLTGCPVIVNTSFNVRGEPIVCSPSDAYTCFMRTEMDVLVLGDLLLLKEEQPEWKEKDWRKKVGTD
jgi:carbamoyltransferase